MHHTIHPRLLVFLTLFIPGLFHLPSPSLAQERVINVTSRLASDTVPPFIRIESGALRNESRLLVWGAAGGADGAPVGRLYYQWVRPGDSGAARQLLDEAYRPSDFVTVVPLEDRFLVLWNDNRPDLPGLYRLWIGLDGGVLGDAQFVHASGSTTDVRVVYGAAGITMLWSDVSRKLYVQRVAHDGRVLIAPTFLGVGSAGSARTLVGAPDILTITVDGALRVVDAEHRFS